MNTEKKDVLQLLDSADEMDATFPDWREQVIRFLGADPLRRYTPEKLIELSQDPTKLYKAYRHEFICGAMGGDGLSDSALAIRPEL